MRKKTVKTRKGGGKDKYEGVSSFDILRIKKIKEFLHRVSGDGGNQRHYTKYIDNRGKFYDERSGVSTSGHDDYTKVQLKSGYYNTFYEQVWELLFIIKPYHDLEKCIENILTKCDKNCREYRNALQKIYTRIDDPEWMFTYGDHSTNEIITIEPYKLQEYKQSLRDIRKTKKRIMKYFHNII